MTAFVLLGSTSATAQILNGSFTTGDLSDWQVLGDPSVIASGTPATLDGSNQAFIQSTDGVNPDVSASATLIAATLLTPDTILPPTYNNDLDDLSSPYGVANPAENGQAIYQTFTLSSAATLTFAYSFQTDDYQGFDSTGYTLDGNYYQLAIPTNVYPATDPDPTPYTTVNLSLTAGTHTLGFVAYNTNEPAVANSEDTEGPTTLFVSDIATIVVPEPSASGMILFGMLALILLRKLRSHSSSF